jgi:hypothetical protein
METLTLKFRAAGNGLESWSDKRVGHFKSQLEMAREITHQLEMARDFRQLSSLETWLCQCLKEHCLALSSLLHKIARLRSRITWLQEGDANTSLFHSQARYKKRKNFIAKLEDEGQTVINHEDKAQVLLKFYSDLIGTREQRQSSINLEALEIRQHDLHMMEEPISKEEVWNTIKLLPSDKAPGPDGFIGRFYKVCWPIIKGDIMAVVSAVWRRDFRNFRLLNSAYISLLPKMKGAAHAKDFRPISLIHSFAKLVTKILANRLAARLDSMVSTNQMHSSRGASFRTISCWCNKQPDFYTHKNSQEYFSNWISRRLLIRSLGPFSWKS